jgi:DNA mismatch repair protein MutL
MAMKRGTQISVINLFGNVPARKKHLKSDYTEAKYCVDIITRHALQYYNVGFKLIHNDKVLLDAPKTKSLRDKIALVYGEDIAKEMIPVELLGNGRVSGYISKPNNSRSDRQYETLFVNNRFVKSIALNKAVEEAYRSVMFHGRYPIYILHIQVDPRNIDVNVHPSKTVVKIADEGKIYGLILSGIRDVLSKHNLLPSLDHNSFVNRKNMNDNNLKGVKVGIKNFSKIHSKYGISEDKQSSLSELGYADSSNINSVINDSYVNNKDDVRFRILGQIYKTYVLIETEEGLMVIDQHAAHERVLFEELYNQWKSKKIPIQTLLEPLLIDMSAKEYITFQNNKEYLVSLGFVFEDFGDKSILIRQVPKMFKKFDMALFRELISSENAQKQFKDKIQNMIATMACRAAIKAGDELTNEMIKKLLLQMKNPKFPYSCPHGRPTTILITEKDLEKLFKRNM